MNSINSVTIDKYCNILLSSLIPLSILFSEAICISNYIIEVMLCFCVFILCFKRIIKKELLELNYIDCTLITISIVLFVNSYINDNLSYKHSIFVSIFFYFTIYILSKQVLRKMDISIFIYQLVISNILTLFYICFSFFKYHSFISYLENQFSNIGICAIFLAFSSTVILDFIYIKKRSLNFILTLIVVINVLIVFYLKSRISIFIVIIYCVLLLIKRIKKKKRNIIYISVGIIFFLFLSLCTKIDSSEGRFLILRISTRIIMDNPLLGVGINKFSVNYPFYQADYFASGSGTEKDVILAGNIRYALNEPIQLLCETGIIGIILISFLVFQQISLLNNINNKILSNALYRLILISTCYYIFHITIFQIIIFLIFIYTSSMAKTIYSFNKLLSNTIYFILILTTIYLYYPTKRKFIYSIDIKKKISQNHSLIENQPIISNYFNNNFIFIYTLARELYDKGKYKDCLKVLYIIDDYFIHSDIENLKGKSYLKLNQIKIAESHFINACNIYPSKFEYKYELFNLYLKNRQLDLAKEIAIKIKNQKEKIPTAVSLAIKLEINDFLKSLNKGI